MDLMEMAAIGNLKAVLHFLHSGVDVNAQNPMNGWTALHWAAHRGHEPIVRALLMRGASKDLKEAKGRTAADLSTKPEIAELFGVDLIQKEEQRVEESESSKSTWVPSYLAQPDLSKLWSLPEGSTENADVNKEAFELSRSRASATAESSAAAPGSSSVASHATTSVRTPPVSATASAPTTFTSNDSREILVYAGTPTDDCLLGAVYPHADDTIERAIELIREDIDNVPEQFTLARFNGSKAIPVNTKQYSRKLGEIFRGEDAMVLVPK
ncbi:hypothetical protein DFQ27_005061 [Actinomortierella ambigua]|uniref:Ankyrin n=1 Tax=Actinomortierella ambigua TaxID=1343610 RepID=A0A9P6Q186_9FUNG|nr:hypothetical protein DFQ27_005061 [Actinomortierella ambigua]